MNKLYLAIMGLGVYLIIVGVLSVAKPELSWRVSNFFRSWQFENPEPSEDSLTFHQMMGVGMILVGLFLTVGFLF